MNMKTAAITFGLVFLTSVGVAEAEGELNIFTWGNYTSPEMVKKFESTYDIKVTITDYDSNDTALAKVRQGGHGFDVVVPSANVMPIWISEDLLLETRPDEMQNFKNVDPRFVDVPFDPGRHYSAPWLWGTTGIAVNTSKYKGDINTMSIILDPPDELVGKINVVPEMADIMYLTTRYVGGEPCTDDKAVLKKVRDKLLEAKPKWISMDYSSMEKMIGKDIFATVSWNGATMRMRLQNPDIKYGYPKEGYPIWMDGVAVLKDAKNVENAKLFQNFIMDPENAALISSFTKYANSIKGSDAYLPEELRSAPEIVVPAELQAPGAFMAACAPDVLDLYSKIWTGILK